MTGSRNSGSRAVFHDLPATFILPCKVVGPGTTMSGPVVHFEIPADNVERARKFYQKTFSWEMQPMPEMNYTMVRTTPADASGMPKEPGAINGGMASRGGPVKSTVVTIGVDNIDQVLKTVAKNGGKTVVGKQSIGPMGFTAYFQDSEGNVVGLWQAAKE